MESSSGYSRVRCPRPRTRQQKARHSRERTILRGMQDPANVVGQEVLLDTSAASLLLRVVGADTLSLVGIHVPKESSDLDQRSVIAQ